MTKKIQALFGSEETARTIVGEFGTNVVVSFGVEKLQEITIPSVDPDKSHPVYPSSFLEKCVSVTAVVSGQADSPYHWLTIIPERLDKDSRSSQWALDRDPLAVRLNSEDINEPAPAIVVRHSDIEGRTRIINHISYSCHENLTKSEQIRREAQRLREIQNIENKYMPLSDISIYDDNLFGYGVEQLKHKIKNLNHF